jgi:hypothetical protein
VDCTAFDRCTERLEHAGAKLGKLIQKECTAMRERHLARPWLLATPDHPVHRDGMVGRSERTAPDQRGSRAGKPADAAHGGNFERLLQIQRGEYPRETGCQHRLPGARLTREKEIVSSGGGNFERPFPCLLPPYIGELGHRLRSPGGRGSGRVQGPAACEKAQHLAQIPGPHHGAIRYSCHLAEVRPGHDQQPEVRLASQAEGDREHAGHRSDTPIETELAHECRVRQEFGGYGAGSCEDADQKRKIEVGARFRKVCGS